MIAFVGGPFGSPEAAKEAKPRSWRYNANRFSYSGTRVVSRISPRIASLCSDFFCVDT